MIAQRTVSAFLLSAILLGGCGEIFHLTPYDTAPPDDLRDLTAKHQAAIEAAWGQHEGPITIALTSDPHYLYGELSDIVGHISADPSIAFVLVPGDLADQGLLGEFIGFARMMEDLPVPWIASIGNHDHLGNGPAIYQLMFGPRNFIMDLAHHRFIFFDDTVWESDTPPDLPWLAHALATTGDRIPIVMAHIPPFSDQLQGSYEMPMQQLMADAGVPLFIHGHQHVFHQNEPYLDGVRYLCVPWPREHAYVKLTLHGADIQVQLVTL